MLLRLPIGLLTVAIAGCIWLILPLIGIDRMTSLTVRTPVTVATLIVIFCGLTALSLRAWLRPGDSRTHEIAKWQKIREAPYGNIRGIARGLLSGAAGALMAAHFFGVISQHTAGKLVTTPAVISEIKQVNTVLNPCLVRVGMFFCRKRPVP
jgi:hypothetical protein